MTTLLVAALRAEVAALEPRPAGFDLVVTGPGKVRSTLGLASRLASGSRPDLVVVIGTAGALRPGLGGLYEPVRAVDHEFDSESLEMLTGLNWPAEVAIREGPGLSVATGDRFVADRAGRERLASRGLDLVDMETFAYVCVARSFGLPIRVAKYVTDDADEGATRAWPQAVATASHHLADWVASGMPPLR